MKSKILIILSVFAVFLLAPLKAIAVCPVCTFVVAGGLGFSRYVGIDDAIVGVWIGGLLLSLTIWTVEYLKKKKIKFMFRKIIIFAAYYVGALLPLYYINMMGIECDAILGISKLMSGVIFGTVIFAISVWLNYYLKKENNGKVYFPYQKVIIPLAFLTGMSLVFYVLSMC